MKHLGRSFYQRLSLIAVFTLGAGLGLADAASKKEIAAAPAWVRPLHCRDLISADAEKVLAGERFRGWFEGMMGPLTERLQLHDQKEMDKLYALLLTYCSKDQDVGAIDAVMAIREMIEGVMPSAEPPRRRSRP